MIYYDIYYKNKLPEAFTSIENKHYFELYKNGDKNAREELILHNLKLVLNIVKKYKNYNSEDLISIGTIGLVKAIDTFDIDKGYTFSTYAARCIENEILMYFRKKENKEIYKISLDDTITSEKDGNCKDSLKMLDILKEDTYFIEDLEEQELYNAVRESFSILTDIEKQVIQMSFGFSCEKPMKGIEIANYFGCSRKKICDIDKRARLKIKEHIESKGLIECNSKKLLGRKQINRKY